jgi:hypothetical protein
MKKKIQENILMGWSMIAKKKKERKKEGENR